MKFIRNNWQGFVFSAVGFFALYHFYRFLQDGKVAEAGVVFGFAFLSFLYANLSRFKRFKGLGFEAELWEDKQKEAADLIDRLKSVVTIYTQEIVMNKVMWGRFGDGQRWKETWDLYEELVAQHNVLGQKIDFTKMKSEIDRVFTFDMTLAPAEDIASALNVGREEAAQIIAREFGNIINDPKAYSARVMQNDIQTWLDDPFKISETKNVADELLNLATLGAAKLKKNFGIEVKFEDEALYRLRAISKLYGKPIKVTEELISWADRKG